MEQGLRQNYSILAKNAFVITAEVIAKMSHQNGASSVISKGSKHLPLDNKIGEASHWGHLCYCGYIVA